MDAGFVSLRREQVPIAKGENPPFALNSPIQNFAVFYKWGELKMNSSACVGLPCPIFGKWKKLKVHITLAPS